MEFLGLYLLGAFITAILTSWAMKEKDGWTTGVHLVAAILWPGTLFCGAIGFAVGLGKLLSKRPGR